MPGFSELGFALLASLVLGIAALLIVYKMIDGDMPVLAGLGGIGGILFMLFMTINPINPAVPMVVMIVSVVCLALFPFASEQLEKVEIRVLETDRLVRSYNAFAKRPDNTAAAFEIANRLYKHGMKANAIGLATATLNRLSQQLDPVTNRSFRDTFRNEEMTLRNWNREAAANPQLIRPVACPNCKFINPPDALICAQCGRPYLLDVATNMNLRPRVFGRILLAFGALSALIVGASAVGLYFSGYVLILMILIQVIGAGAVLHFLFRPPVPR